MKIQRENVITTALDLLDQVGIEGLTMRRLADALDIKAASLYWHFSNKQELLDGMADILIQEVARDIDTNTDWDHRLRQVAREMRVALAARRDGVRVFGGTYIISANGLRVAEALIGPLRAAGLADHVASWSASTVLYYVRGFVMEVQGFAADDASALSQRRAQFSSLASGRFPHVQASMEAIFETGLERRFDTGLELIIAGLRQTIAAP
ncbi:TetR/AcrR family transcriptional regulator C-terminal domain-containing protein [Janthinobacterium agaricidamnosum]|uniref:Bacterial regulatory s, tetR family protein n=1 Tax=Janthinobacterium agaricidamnosum NBRC 102515 = DSM 9628 TaxID=1349767 RepID=W0VD61_9BURK|nr:TetR/AcrR family transcriptional regulator C-terminal domain-containing protein [Janthinobacterium agaricidamnosum]CDG85595.1 bacterial regulatory s, tetR family protein [Janthinobacterium agaricidamnosum NBRC 102515 = DSM 9628]